MRQPHFDRSMVLLTVATLTTFAWLILEVTGQHPDSGLLGVAAPLWASWATIDRQAHRVTTRRRKMNRRDDTKKVKNGAGKL